MTDVVHGSAAQQERLQPHPAAPTALWDVVTAVHRWQFWTFLAWQDIRQRYRGSKLGPFWTVANVAFVAAGVGLLYSGIFNEDLNTFVPFLTAGIIFWFLIANCVSDSTVAFQQGGSMIRQAALPLFAFPLRVVTRNVIVLAHNALVYIAICFIFAVRPNLVWLIPGVVLLVLNVGWVTVLCALLGARYRDAVQMIQNALTLVLFLSPIFWRPGQASGRAVMVHYNPVAHLLEIVRTPALGSPPNMDSIWICLAMAAIGWIVALGVFLRVRHRIVHWL